MHYREYKKEVKKAKKTSWRKFCSEIEGCSETSRFAKIMRYQPKYAIGLLRNEQGVMTSTPEETLEVLANSSFPMHTRIETEASQDAILRAKSIKRGKFTPKTAEWRSVERVKKAIHSFLTMKAAGPDEVRPIVLQNLPDEYASSSDGRRRNHNMQTMQRR